MVQHAKADDRQSARIRIRVSLQMTDQDVVERVRVTFGLGNVRRYQGQKAHHKDTYSWSLSAMGAVAALLVLLRPQMGERRRGQIDACLAAVEEAGGVPTRQRRHGISKYQY